MTFALIAGLNQKSLLILAALAAKWETPPKDALDTLVLRCYLWYPEYSEKKAQLNEEKKSPKDIEAELSDKIGDILRDELKVLPFILSPVLYCRSSSSYIILLGL